MSRNSADVEDDRGARCVREVLLQFAGHVDDFLGLPNGEASIFLVSGSKIH